MADLTELKVGPRIRDLRERAGWSIRALAERSGLSPNAISLIERSVNSPTVSTLHQLAEALGVPITSFFQQEQGRSAIFLKRNQGVQISRNGRLIERLGSGESTHGLEAFAVTIEPGAGNMDEPVFHSGQEFVRCLEGQVEYFIDDHLYFMEAGDSLLFDAKLKHCFRNVFRHAAQILIIFHAGKDQEEARHRHLGRS